MIPLLIALFLASPAANAGEKSRVVARMGEFELLQRDPCKRVCNPWVKHAASNEKFEIRAMDGIGRLTAEADHSGEKTRVFNWTQEAAPEAELRLTLELIELDKRTTGLLVTTRVGFQTIMNDWQLFVLRAGRLRRVLEGSAGVHSPPTIAQDWGFVKQGRSLGYYFLSYFWVMGEADDGMDPKTFFQFETKRWIEKTRLFVDAGRDPIPLWALILASGQGKAVTNDEVRSIQTIVQACEGIAPFPHLVSSEPFKLLARGTWAFASFTPDKAKLEELREKLKKCAPALQSVLKQAL